MRLFFKSSFITVSHSNGVARPCNVTLFKARVVWPSASKSVQSITTIMSVDDPTTSGTHRAAISHGSMAWLLRSRSTCLIACRVRRPRAWAKDLPITATANDALTITPSVAWASDSTRLPWRSPSSSSSRNAKTPSPHSVLRSIIPPRPTHHQSGLPKPKPSRKTGARTMRGFLRIESDHFRVKQPMPKVGSFRSFNTARRSIQGFEAMLWLGKGFGFAGTWTVVEQNRMLGFCFELQRLTKRKIRKDNGQFATDRRGCDTPSRTPQSAARRGGRPWPCRRPGDFVLSLVLRAFEIAPSPSRHVL